MSIKVFSDCGSYNNGYRDPSKPMFGSIGVVVINEKDEIIYKNVKVFEDKTNNYCELLGMLDGLIYAVNNYPNESIDVYSDSEYVIKGASERVSKWKRMGWKNSNGPVKNKELWEIVAKINETGFDINYNWVRGHQGKKTTKDDNYFVYYQEMCDSLAVEIIDKKVKAWNHKRE